MFAASLFAFVFVFGAACGKVSFPKKVHQFEFLEGMFFFFLAWFFWPGQRTFFDALARVGTYRHISQHPQLVTGLKNAISLCITHRHILVAHAHHLKIDSNFHNVCHENAIDFRGVWGLGSGVWGVGSGKQQRGKKDIMLRACVRVCYEYLKKKKAALMAKKSRRASKIAKSGHWANVWATNGPKQPKNELKAKAIYKYFHRYRYICMMVSLQMRF